ncbi:hypothetical protein AMJ87_04125 [candidate division WOR_3 bacterium SM23_60]|uniref:SnoaL-like domain-containing protein n=1 Tax=candidate division WOR_3 bacterium SM23_60 TaxID=1703780 RepID=A0A0S8GI30_UNCW3|nr:MAG: hypothetical protein AMJ87_04125 [candidate division WOR_3 bacterium SM23_60]
MKKILLAAVVIFVIVGAYLIVQALTLSEAERAAQHIKALAAAVEREERDAVLNYIDSTYLDQRRMSYTQFISMIDEFFATLHHINVQIHNLEVTIDSAHADTAFFASCSLGLRVTARHEDDRVLVFGGLVKPTPVRAYFKRTNAYYRLYDAQY